jgi:SAM-dependent methyltransferase
MSAEVPPLDLSARASNLAPGPDGIWFAAGDVDQAFASDDRTDWVEVENRSFWYRHRNEVVLDTLARFPPQGWLFEIGAGNGAVCAAAQAAGWPVVAVEPTVAWARNARLRGLSHVICAHFQNAGFAPGALENVALFDVLEHIEDDARFLADLRRLMPTDGRLYLAVPAFRFLWSREDELSGHCRRYLASQLEERVAAAGFRVEHRTYFFAPLMPAVLVGRALPYRLGLVRDRTHASSAAEHGLSDSLPVRLMRAALRGELALLRSGVRLPLGGSLLVVARAV